jgi:hypothetical protein
MRPFLMRLVLLAGLCWPAGIVHAELVCPQPVVQLATVKAGVPLVQRYRIINSGPEPIEIVKLHSSCGCLSPHVDRRTLEQGEQTEVALEVNTLTQGTGPHTWRVQVFYREGMVERELALYLSAQVLQEIGVHPPSLTIYTDIPLEPTLTLLESRPQPLTITAVQAPGHVAARIDEPHQDDSGRWVRTVHLQVLGDHPTGRHEQRLHLRTSDPVYADLAIPITVVKRSADQVRATPSSVQLSAEGGQPVPSRIVLFGCESDLPVRIEQVDVPDRAIRCTWVPGPGPRSTLRIQIDREQIVGDTLRSTIRIHFLEPRPQTLDLPITCTVH